MSEERKIKRVKFVVDLLFTEAIDKKHIPDISHKIADALRHECSSGNGFAPDENSGYTDVGYTTEIRVFNAEAGITTVKIEPGKGWVESFEKI